MKIRRLFELKGICCILIKVVVIAMYTFVKTHQLQLEEEMATHSSIIAWRIPWTEEPGGLQLRGPES